MYEMTDLLMRGRFVCGVCVCVCLVGCWHVGKLTIVFYAFFFI